MGRRPDGQGAAAGFNSAWSWLAEVAWIRNRETATNPCTSSETFVPQPGSSPDLVREALSLGASGCIHKTNTSSDLLPAIEAVLRGEPFVSKSLEVSGRRDAPRRHEVQFYSHDSVLLQSFARILATALETGDGAVVLAMKSHQRLKAEGFDVDVAMRPGTYVSLDAADTLSTVSEWCG